MSERSWRAAFASYDDATLGKLANAGLVRRAHRDVDEGRVGVVVESPEGATMDVGGAIVRVSRAGPPGVACDCPATGTCQHILAATIWIREHSLEGTDTGISALDELLSLEPLAVSRAAGLRAARFARAVATAEAKADEPVSERVATLVSDDLVDISLTGAAHVIRFVRGAGFEGMVSDFATADRAERHLTAVRLVFEANGLSWEWPANVADSPASAAVGLTDAQRMLIADLGDSLSGLLRSGLAHLSGDQVDRLESIAFECRAVGLFALGRLVSNLSGVAASVQVRDDGANESELLTAMAEVKALSQALLAWLPAGAQNDELFEALLGSSRKSFSEVQSVDLIPLDARWFESASGGRGVILSALEPETGEVLTATSARAAAADPSFHRDGSAMLWGKSVKTLTSGPFRLVTPRVDRDGTLAASTLSSVREVADSAFPDESLKEIAVTAWSALPLVASVGRGPSFGRNRESLVVLAPSGVGPVRLDEIGQRLSWELTDFAGAMLLAGIDLGSAGERRANALLALIESRATISYVCGIKGTRGGRLTFEPSSVFVRAENGLELRALDFVTEPWRGIQQDNALRERLHRVVVRAGSVADSARRGVAEQPGLVDRLCIPVRNVLEDLAITGRTKFTDRQAEVLRRQRSMAQDLAVTSIAQGISRLLEGDSVDPGALLACEFVVERALSTVVRP